MTSRVPGELPYLNADGSKTWRKSDDGMVRSPALKKIKDLNTKLDADAVEYRKGYHERSQQFIKTAHAKGNKVKNVDGELVEEKPGFFERASGNYQKVGRNVRKNIDAAAAAVKGAWDKFQADQNTPDAKLKRAQRAYDEGAGGGSRPK